MRQQQQPSGTATASNSLIYASVNPAKIVTHKPSNVNLQRDNINVNFSNAVYNKNFLSLLPPSQQQLHDNNGANEMTHENTLFSNNVSTSDVENLSEDLSMLPVIDDKTLLSSLKAKFEMRKYFVSKIKYFFKDFF